MSDNIPDIFRNTHFLSLRVHTHVWLGGWVMEVVVVVVIMMAMMVVVVTVVVLVVVMAKAYEFEYLSECWWWSLGRFWNTRTMLEYVCH